MSLLSPRPRARPPQARVQGEARPRVRPQSQGQDRSPAGDTVRAVLRRHAAGVTVVTVPGPAGFTATSCTAVSLQPALLSFCVGLGASALPRVRAAQHFAVHLLAHRDADLAHRFARSGVDRFAGVDWSPGPHDVPLLSTANGWLLAEVVLRQRLGDHLQVVGEVAAVGGDGLLPPLIRHGGAFTTVRDPLTHPDPGPALPGGPEGGPT